MSRITRATSRITSSVQHAEGGGVTCPICHFSDLDYIKSDYEAPYFWQKVRCLACGTSWINAYRLAGYEELTPGHKDFGGGEAMILFETAFGLEEVLEMRPGPDNTVSHELIDKAWDRWAEAQPAKFQEHDENAYARVEVGQTTYIVTIEAIAICDRDTFQLYGRYLTSHQL